MKLEDLIAMLAEEITSTQPQLNKQLDKLALLPVDATDFSDVLAAYSDQIQRMGEAADMVGFSGLLLVSEHLQENTLLLATLTPSEREPVIAFLREWPELMVHYLHNLHDASVAAGLVDALRDAPHPMDEEQCFRVMHKLGSLPAQVDFEEHDPANERPVLADIDMVSLQVPADVDPNLMNSFLQEAPEQAAYLVKLIGNIIGSSPADLSDLTAAKRAVHTLKGTSSIIGIPGIANLGHHFEDILEYFESQDGDVPAAVSNILTDAGFCLEQMVAFIGGQDESPQQAQSILQDVLDLANRIDKGDNLQKSLRRGESAPTAAVAAPVATPATNTQRAASALRIDLDRIDELFRVSAEVSVHTGAMEAAIKQINDRTKALLMQHLRVKKRLYELETVVDVRTIGMMRSMSKGNQTATFDPLEMEQYNELHSTAHAMVEDANDAIVMAQHVDEALAKLVAMQTQQQNLSKDLQHLVIGTRMAEVGTLEPRLQRNIRTTCQTTGKQAVLTLEGANTLIDTDVLNHLSEPLLHLLRNAVDHGLETPQQRAEAGKPEVGNITLDFSKQGQQVVMRCRDDGRGLDYARIRERAIERGLITAEQQLSDNETAQLLLTSGFSTRDEVSQISGRGVGLDVVREWALGMNGDVRILSEFGSGTTIELRFAASLSTSQALIVEAAKQNFALSSLQVEQAQARGVGSFVESGNNFQYRYEQHGKQQVVAAEFLADLVGLPRGDRALADYSAVIIHIQDETYALAVDALVDSRELLVKDPDRYTRHLPEVVGMSILGDGSVIAHLDMPQLLSKERTSTRAAPSRQHSQAESDTVSNVPKVLIVDDSLSVRNVLQELIEDLGLIAKTARDGMEAIDVLGVFHPDLVLTDLEMPNMNGVELTSHIRGRDDMPDVPIIMITSRSQAKHRELAEQAGVDEYVTKPYNEVALLQLIEQALKQKTAAA